MQGEPIVILLVEDNPDHAELVMRSLEEHRIANHIFHVKDGQEALDYLFRKGPFIDAAKSPRPHVILLDLRLPKLDGVYVLKVIKGTDALRQIPVVVVTTSDSEKDLVKAYENHVNSYLVKPVDFEKFEQMMRDLGFYWLAWNQAPYVGP